MIYRILLILAVIIFITNFFILPGFFDIETSNTGTFVGLIMLAAIIGHLLNKK